MGRFSAGIAALSLGIAAISAISVGGALVIEHIGGIRPCPLCLDQRIAYYAAIPAALLAAWLAGRVPLLHRSKRRLQPEFGKIDAKQKASMQTRERSEGVSVLAARILLALIAIGFVANTVLGVYHAGIEWGWWLGPDSCSGMAPIATTPEALRESLRRPAVVRCDAAAMRVLGISLAGYSALVSALLAVAALTGATQRQTRP